MTLDYNPVVGHQVCDNSVQTREEAVSDYRRFGQFWILLVFGVLLRCVALNQPLIDNQLLRQNQTAAATASLIAQPGIPLSSRIPWLGDLNARYVLELPLYNYLVIAAHKSIGHLDVSGKLVSIALWACGFAVLQGIWRRCLTSRQTFWANLLFVISPLSVFYGQAFMPEMLVQLLAFGFILLTLRYCEQPTSGRWVACAMAGLLGLLIKLPEIAHLYLILAILIVRKEKWKSVARLRYWVAAVGTLVAVKAWSNYMDSVNIAYLPQWTGMGNLRLFIGTIASRFHFKPWAMIGFYLGAFGAPGFAALMVAGGLWSLMGKGKRTGELPDAAREASELSRRGILKLWIGSVAVFYLLWFGNTAATQNYYNLVALAPLCALFAKGSEALLDRWCPSLGNACRGQVNRQTSDLKFCAGADLEAAAAADWRSRFGQKCQMASLALVLLVMVSVIPGNRHLFKPDQSIYAAALWAKEHTRTEDVILFRPNHRPEMTDYPYNAVFQHYAQRSTFVWTTHMPESLRRAALDRAHYAIVTLPRPQPGGVFGMINQFRGLNTWKPQSVDFLEANGFCLVEHNQIFEVYRRPVL